MNLKHKTIIGRSAHISLPDWDIPDLLAKTDTGARTSSLHVENLTKLSNGRVEFYVITKQKPEVKRVKVRAHATKWAKVLSSSGHYTYRCFVKTTAIIGGIEKDIEISLISREKMAFRMLIGREALAKDFLVDVTRTHQKPKVKKDPETSYFPVAE